MPFESEAQRRFMFAKHPKIAKEFAAATPEGADLPEHVKKMADGGAVDAMPDLESSPEAFDKGMKHENVTHDSDAVKSYLASKLRGLFHPGEEQTPVADTDTVKAPGMSEGGYPHVTFMENMPQEEVEKVVHLGNSPTPEPAKAEASQEEKTDTVYRAMGMGKYAVGGIVPPAPVGPQVGAPGMLNQADPNFWEQVKAALSKVSAPITGAANAAVAPLEAGAKMAAPLVPPAVSAINRLTGADLPVPAAPAAPAPDLSAPSTPLAAPVAATPAPVPPAVAPKGIPGAGQPSDLKNLFSQDTSKLTEGVNAEDRQKVADTMTGRQTGVGSMIAEALAGLGDAVAAKGGRDQHALKDIFTMQKQQRDEALANFDKNRQARLEKLDLQTKMGNNSIQKLAAQDAYGVDENLNKQLGAPPGTAHKDLPLYMQMMTAKVAQGEKDSDLYIKAHAQAASEIDSSIKNAGIFNVKPSPAQIQAAGAKLADTYYNRAKGNVLFQPSDGQKPVWLPAGNVQKARQMDPNGQIIP